MNNNYNASKVSAIYQKVISGEYKTFSQLADIVSQLSNLIPELDINSSGGINNYTQKELEQIVKQFVIRVQNQQINEKNKENTNTVGYVENQRKQKAYITDKWKQRIQPYYEEHKNSIKDIPQLLSVTDGEGFYKKMYEAFIALDILDIVIFNKQRKYFEVILWHNRSGTGGMKLTLSLFKRIINDKIRTVSDNQYGNKNQKPLPFQVKKTLHPNVKESNEYKFVVKLFQLLHSQLIYNKVNKYMNKNIDQKLKPNAKQLGDKLFNKMKSVSNLKIKGEFDVEDKLYAQSQIKDKFFNLQNKQKYGFQVLEDKNTLKPLDNKFQPQQKEKFFEGFKYIPKKEEEDILKDKVRIETKVLGAKENFQNNKRFFK